jgi:hypothetical protein
MEDHPMNTHTPTPQDDGIQEIAGIFARGYLRLKQRRGENSAVNCRGENSDLDVRANPSLHVPVVNSRTAANPNLKEA